MRIQGLIVDMIIPLQKVENLVVTVELVVKISMPQGLAAKTIYLSVVRVGGAFDSAPMLVLVLWACILQ